VVFGLPWHILLPTLLGSLLAGALCSAIGVFVIRMKLTSLGFAMSHAAFAGAALGILLGISDPIWMSLVLALFAAALLGPLADASRMSVDTILAVVFPVSMALGLLFLNLAPSSGIGNGALALLWGSLLGITMPSVLILTGVAVVFAGTLLLFWKPFFALLLDRKLALATGLPVTEPFYALLFLVALVVATSLRVTGGLLIYSLMVLPASAALQWVYDIKKALLLAPALGIVASLGGATLSLFLDLPMGASITLTAAALFLASVGLSPKRRRGRASA
jgi:ABC-type Mn2+/Zn2+ transport system permease subunit